MSLEDEITIEIKSRGADFVTFADISSLSNEQNKGFSSAILFGMALSPDYLTQITQTPDYVENMIQNNLIDRDEFHLKEKTTDRLAEEMANFLTRKGYNAYAQSEDNIYNTGFYNTQKQTTPLPHKTVALLAGLGWIGKHNLLVTPEYGSALSMCTVLTDAPLKTVKHVASQPQCGDCQICRQVCTVKALKGNVWKPGLSRDELLDATKCITCLKCMVFCPFTQNYMKQVHP